MSSTTCGASDGAAATEEAEKWNVDDVIRQERKNRRESIALITIEINLYLESVMNSHSCGNHVLLQSNKYSILRYLQECQ